MDMKTLVTIIILILPLFGNSQIQPDKVKHFAVGTALSGASSFAALQFGADKKEAFIIGFGIGMAAGIAKEVYDMETGKGTPSTADMLWTIAGAAVGSVSVSITIKERAERRQGL